MGFKNIIRQDIIDLSVIIAERIIIKYIIIINLLLCAYKLH